MPETFPSNVPNGSNDTNPAFRLFGRRFFSDQSSIEFLIECLLVANSQKRVENRQFNNFLPPRDILGEPWHRALDYSPKARLNLKIFSFFGASKLDTRHEIHRQHLEELDRLLKEKMQVFEDTKENVLKTLENLFLGFHGVGMQRTWCAQSFAPICPSLLAGETLWNESFARNNPPNSWEDLMIQHKRYFSSNKHRFLACGGEMIYLQICNALRKKTIDLSNWIENAGLNEFLTSEEQNPDWLHEQIEKAIGDMMQEVPATVSKLAEFIDSGVEKDTSTYTDFDGGTPKWVSCGWCPAETWPEGYLFAVEFFRVCRAKLDLMDKTDLLETLCSLHVMRSLITQGSRYADGTDDIPLWPDYYLAISDPEGKNQAVKHVSKATIHKVSKTIYKALRHPLILRDTPSGELDKLYKQADNNYGHKLFLTMGKRIGLIVPKRGTGTRFVLNANLLRLLVICLSPGRRMTYDDFKRAAISHFGLAFDENALGASASWAMETGTESFGGATDDWVVNMLEEAGSLRRLSDSCALVENLASPES